jgi:endonuclease III
MEQLICRLVDEGRELLHQPRQAALFAYDPAADAILNDIERYPQAFVLGCLANRMGKAKQAWKVPLRLRERFETLDLAALAQKTEADWVRVAHDPTPIHRRPELMAKVFRLGVQRLQDSYDGDAARIWVGSPPSATVVRRFLEFHGAGPKIASMAVNILVRQFKIPLRDYYFVDISVDVQVRRVMTRLGFVPEGTSDELLIYAAREAHPEFPGIFDLALWRIGKDVCTPTAPHCGTCPLAEFCAYAAARRAASPRR